MKIKLPHREVNLKSDVSYFERNEIIKKVLNEKIDFLENSMKVEDYFSETWDKQGTRTALDMMSYYLTKGNAEGEDKEILSHRKQKELQRGSKRHITFSALGVGTQERLGIIDTSDSELN